MEHQDQFQTIAVSSRVRLARNLSGLAFPTVRGERQKDIPARAFAVLNESEPFRRWDVRSLSETELVALKERYLISADLIGNRESGSVLLSMKEDVSVMVNEEDHLREQCFARGFRLREAYERIDRIDTLLGDRLNFAFDPKRGYLTSCPTNLGTGMRASVMLFLPALTASRSIASIVSAVSQERIEVRGVYGEGSEAEGCLYQVSNRVSLGLSESEILDRVESAVERIADAERAARESGYAAARTEWQDRVMRAFGILTYAVRLSTEEFMTLIAEIKLGAALGILNVPDFGALEDLSVKVQPANLTLWAGELDAEGRDTARADYVRRTLREIVSNTEQGAEH